MHRVNAEGDNARKRARNLLNAVGSMYCARCGEIKAADQLQIDHIIPLADGGEDRDSNVEVLCIPCHKTKTTEENKQRKNPRKPKSNTVFG